MSRSEHGQRGPVSLGYLSTSGDGQMSMRSLIDLQAPEPLTKTGQRILERRFGSELTGAIARDVAAGNSPEQ